MTQEIRSQAETDSVTRWDFSRMLERKQCGLCVQGDVTSYVTARGLSDVTP